MKSKTNCHCRCCRTGPTVTVTTRGESVETHEYSAGYSRDAALREEFWLQTSPWPDETLKETGEASWRFSSSARAEKT